MMMRLPGQVHTPGLDKPGNGAGALFWLVTCDCPTHLIRCATLSWVLEDCAS